MTSTYGIDVVFLHDLDVLDHALRRYDVTSVRIHFVPVGSLEQDWLSVYQYLGVFQFDLAETDFHRNNLSRVAAVFQSCDQCVENRSFGSPFLRIPLTDEVATSLPALSNSFRSTVPLPFRFRETFKVPSLYCASKSGVTRMS